MSASLARRYVLPLFEVALARNILDKVSGDLNTLSEMIRQSEELRTFVNSPTIERAVKRAVFEKLLQGASEYSLNFVKVIIDKKRTDAFLIAGRLFDEMLSQHRGETHGVVESAQALDEASFTAIQNSVAARFGKKVILSREIVPELVGGIRIQVGHQVIDASIRGRLEKMKNILAGE